MERWSITIRPSGYAFQLQHKSIVSPRIFATAQEAMRERGHREHTTEELLERLRYLLKKHGYLSSKLIIADREGPYLSIYLRRFGNIRKAYERIGYVQTRDAHDRDWDRQIHLLSVGAAKDFMNGVRERGVTVCRAKHRGGTITIGKSLTVAVAVAIHKATPAQKKPAWLVGTNRTIAPDYTIVARLYPDNARVCDFFFLPRSEVKRWRIYLGDHNLSRLERYRCATLTELVERAVAAAAIKDCSEALARPNALRPAGFCRDAVRNALRQMPGSSMR
jgi:hypothetical protein